MDWEHLPWLHHQSFLSVKLLDITADTWRGAITMPPADRPKDAVIEVSCDRPNLPYWSRTVEGRGAGTEIFTRLVAGGRAHDGRDGGVPRARRRSRQGRGAGRIVRQAVHAALGPGRDHDVATPEAARPRLSRRQRLRQGRREGSHRVRVAPEKTAGQELRTAVTSLGEVDRVFDAGPGAGRMAKAVDAGQLLGWQIDGDGMVRIPIRQDSDASPLSSRTVSVDRAPGLHSDARRPPCTRMLEAQQDQDDRTERPACISHIRASPGISRRTAEGDDVSATTPTPHSATLKMTPVRHDLVGDRVRARARPRASRMSVTSSRSSWRVPPHRRARVAFLEGRIANCDRHHGPRSTCSPHGSAACPPLPPSRGAP